jgi:hypothetical protein
MNRIKRIFMDAAVGFYVAAWHLFIGAAKVTHATVDGIGAAWAWWLKAFGVSDVLERPDASTLAARSAGHAYIGYKAAELLARHMAPWPVLLLLAALYGAWEWAQWARDPARFKRRVARRWDILNDFTAVWLLGGVGLYVGRSATDMGVLAFSVASAALILGAAAIMGFPNK